MAPTSTQLLLLSPAELSYLHTSLSLHPPLRPDSRTATQFRPLTAETDILPSTNGSARICFADGTEAIVGVKAEVERTAAQPGAAEGFVDVDEEDEEGRGGKRGGDNKWVELSIEIPGFRDDDAMPVVLCSILAEALLADGTFTPRLWINRRFHWKLYIDILLLSPPLSYPLPLLSLTTYLALLSTRLPALKSERDEDPLFNDDWDAAVPLYPRDGATNARPPVTILVVAVGENVLFDPSKEELAVADAVLAVSVADRAAKGVDEGGDVDMQGGEARKRDIRLLSARTIDPPARLTPPGVPNYLNTATGGDAAAKVESGGEEGVWSARRGGTGREMVKRMVGRVLSSGVVEEVLDGLEGVEVG
ncbi:Exosome complex component rrp42 [Pseudogymnoascus australis]